MPGPLVGGALVVPGKIGEYDGLPQLTYITNNNTSSDATRTYTALSIGTAAADRVVVVGLATRVNTVPFPLGVTANGVSMRSLIQMQDINSTLGIFSLPISAGTTADFIFSTGGALVNRSGIGVFTLTGYGSPNVPVACTNDSGLLATNARTATASSADCVLAFMWDDFGTEDVTWTGATESFDVGNNDKYSGAINNSPTNPLTVAAAWTTAGNGRLVLAGWKR